MIKVNLRATRNDKAMAKNDRLEALGCVHNHSVALSFSSSKVKQILNNSSKLLC